MNKPNTGAISICHVTRRVNQPNRIGIGANCADDIADVLEPTGNDRLRMRGGPHGTLGIMEQLRRDGAQEKPAKFAPSRE